MCQGTVYLFANYGQCFLPFRQRGQRICFPVLEITGAVLVGQQPKHQACPPGMKSLLEF